MTDKSPSTNPSDNIDLSVLLRKLIGVVVDAIDDQITFARAIRAGVRGSDGKGEQEGIGVLIDKHIEQLTLLCSWVDGLRLGEDEPPAA